MKTKIIKTIAALMLSLLSLPMMGQDYLKIYFKDGHTERHYMHLVESISTTKYDLEGNLHNDYQMQQIVMLDTTYSYYLTEIDSMAFRKVNVEEVKNLGESVQASLEPIFRQCSNFQDLESHIDEIKSIDGIEETYYDGNDLFIQIRDWPVICISRQRIPEDIALSSSSLGRQNTKSLVSTTNDGSSLKAIIGFQMEDDYRFTDSKVKIDLLNTKFSVMGYNPVYDLGDEVDFDFFYRRIFDSNILLIDTHGGYGIFNKKHYLYTGIVSFSNDIVGLNVDRWFNISENIDLDDIGINTCYFEGGNLFNNPFGQRWFFTVTEDYIRKSPYRFESEGPHIVFVAACSSLQGNNILTRSDGEPCYGNDSFAQVFFEKGADVYLGYNQGSYRSSYAANSFFDRLLHGASVEKAFDLLHSLYKYESDKDEQAKLVDLYNQNSKNPKGIFIVKTHTETKTEKKINEEFATNQQVKLNGTTFCWDLYEQPQFGFRISKEPNINESTTGIDVLSNDAHLTGEKYKEVAFSAVYKAEPGATYYYRAYTYDYIHFNWGEERIFTTPKELELSVGSICLNEGEIATVEITSGNGGYTVSVDKPTFATATLSGTTITIKGEAKGTAKVTVKDKSGQTAEIIVSVESDYPGEDTRSLAFDYELEGTRYALYWQSEQNDVRYNADHTPYYRTKFTLDVTNNGSTKTYMVDENVYYTKEGGGQTPCMAIDLKSKKIFIFVNSSNGYSYSLDGYCFVSPLYNYNFQKEIVFTEANFGWWPYFTYNNGLLYLQHFSFAGYYAMTSTRSSNGTWTTDWGYQIYPDEFRTLSEQAGRVLIIR